MTNKKEYINYRVAKSKEAFDDAKLLEENNRWNAAVNRLYYSCFYLVTALLYKHQIKAETHNGVKTAFFFHFIKTTKIEKQLGKFYSSLFDWRQESDYADFVDFDKETADPLIDEVSKLNDKLTELLVD
jgi:uncharacterized protein (UPF0332 family)